ncbi:hypothetical protein [Microvirga sp. VF16]|uniref:hypothetical protein n=1 Tax=Microvirga sp. VF16 TaxID=2807101 RepID=UPI00193E3FE1|nr:hypothetical protein [Microvirga sp. VF16]QRM28566.1 hypothetical protein JO965_20395 [Microvirga sp. VF16]
MKILYVLPLLLASGLYAAAEANAATLDNGRGLNGRGLNGLVLNGTVHESAAAGQAITVILKDGGRVTLQ